MILWIDLATPSYYLVPDEIELPAGSSQLFSSSGMRCRTDHSAIVQWQVKVKDAEAYLQDAFKPIFKRWLMQFVDSAEQKVPSVESLSFDWGVIAETLLEVLKSADDLTLYIPFDDSTPVNDLLLSQLQTIVQAAKEHDSAYPLTQLFITLLKISPPIPTQKERQEHYRQLAKRAIHSEKRADFRTIWQKNRAKS